MHIKSQLAPQFESIRSRKDNSVPFLGRFRRALTPLFGNGAGAIQIGTINVILGKIGKTNPRGKKLTKFCSPRVLLLICFQ